MSRRGKIGARGVLAATVVLACLAPAAYGNSIEQLSVGPGTGNADWWSSFDGASADGTRVIFDTAEALTPDDTDGNPDIYERADGVTTRLSLGPDGGNGNNDTNFKAVSADGKHVFFQTGEVLVAGVPGENDGKCYTESELLSNCSDVYERSGGTTSLVSTGPTATGASYHARLRGISKDGTRAFFSTGEQLVAADTDSAIDIYERSGGTTKLVSTTPMGNGDHDAYFKGSSDDGTRVFVQTEDQLTAADTDTDGDIYERSGGVTTLLSTGPAGGNGAFGASFKSSSADGSRVFMETDEQLTSADTDSSTDVYQRAGGTTTLLSTGPAGGNGSKDAFFAGASKDGSRVWFETSESLVAGDTDGAHDVYERSGGTTSLVSTGPSGGSGAYEASFQGASDDGTRVWIGTLEQLAPTDTDTAFDVYERAGGSTTQVSLPASGGSGSQDVLFAGASADGSHVFLETLAGLVPADTDSFLDVYQRYQGSTTLISTGPGGTPSSYANFLGSSDTGGRVLFETGDQLLSQDTDNDTDLYESLDTPGFPRPKGASPLSIPLVIAYKDCTSANTAHGAPLAYAACKPPVPESDWLTVGTPDANGQGVKSIGVVRLATVVGDSSTPANEADLKLHLSVNDVRRKSDLSDYAGELRVLFDLRMTDKLNGSSPVDTGTVGDTLFGFDASCATTADTTAGSTCDVDTTANAVVPGVIVEGKRAIWQVGTVQVYDGGSDGDTATEPNTLFEREGVFVP